MPNLIGKKVSLLNEHRKFVKSGVIVPSPNWDRRSNSFYVRFDHEDNECKFYYPDAFLQHSLSSNDSEICDDINQIQAKEKNRITAQEEKIRAEIKAKHEQAEKKNAERLRLEILEAEKRRVERERKEQEYRERFSNAYDYLVNERQVNNLIHFTPLINLPSILLHGILPVNILPAESIALDDLRLDNMRDFSCFSISFPNYLLLTKRRNQLPGTPFVLLLIDPAIIKDKGILDVCYFDKNAASYPRDYAMKENFGKFYAKKIFEDFIPANYSAFATNSLSLRDRSRLPLSYPSNPQAEILIRGVVNSKYIKSIVVRTHDDKEKVKEVILPEYHHLVKIEPRFYSNGEGRKDWR